MGGLEAGERGAGSADEAVDRPPRTGYASPMRLSLRTPSMNVLPLGLRLPVLLAAVVAFVLALAFALVARAADAPGGTTPTPPTNPELAMYCSLGVAVLTMLASVMREDNTLISWAPPVVTRILTVFVLGGGAQTCLLAIKAGTPWRDAVIAALTSASIAWATAGKRVPPGLTSAEAVVAKSGRPPPPASPPPAVPPGSPSAPGVAV